MDVVVAPEKMGGGGNWKKVRAAKQGQTGTSATQSGNERLPDSRVDETYVPLDLFCLKHDSIVNSKAY